MDIDQNMLVSYDTINSLSAKRQKTAFFVMNLIKIAQKNSFTIMLLEI